MHCNFTALVTSARLSRGVHALSALGATTVFEPMDTVVATMRLGSSSRLCADVVVVDTTVSEPDAPLADGLLRAFEFIRAIAGISDIHVMASGVRWSALPIIVVGRDDALGSVLRLEASTRKVLYVPQIGHGGRRGLWNALYDLARREYLRFGPTLAESVRALGMLLQSDRGHLVRAGLRVGVRHEEVENALYDGRHDDWFRARRAALRQVLSPIFSGADAMARAVVELERLRADPRAKEERSESLVRLNPALMDIARFEAQPQFSLRTRDGRVVRIDLLRHSYGAAHGRPPSEIVEFKRSGFAQLRRRALSSDVSEGVMQTAEYSEQLLASRERLERRLGSPLGRVVRTVVGGHALDADVERLARARAAAADVRIVGWDEVALGARRRFQVPHGWEPDTAA
jgi:hypothetical protein